MKLPSSTWIWAMESECLRLIPHANAYNSLALGKSLHLSWVSVSSQWRDDNNFIKFIKFYFNFEIKKLFFAYN
jgi:hypothetical protein